MAVLQEWVAWIIKPTIAIAQNPINLRDQSIGIYQKVEYFKGLRYNRSPFFMYHYDRYPYR